MSNTTIARTFVAAEVKGDASRVALVTAIHGEYRAGLITLRDLATAINNRRAEVARDTGVADDRKPMTHTALNLYTRTGELIESFGREVNGVTVAAAWRFIARPFANVATVREIVSTYAAEVKSDDDFDSLIRAEYSRLSALKAGTASSTAGQGGEDEGDAKPTPATKRDPLAVSAGDAVPASADVIVATLEAALTGTYSDADAERISVAIDALQTYLGMPASALATA